MLSSTPESARKTRAPPKVSLDEQVRKALADNFKNWPAHLLYAVEVGGVTLQQRLYADREKAQQDRRSVKFGSRYYKDLRNKYGAKKEDDEEKPKKSLESDGKFEGKDAAVSSTMMRAMVQAKSHPANRKPLCQYLSCCESLSKAELLGATRFFLSLTPSASGEQCQSALAVMRCFARLNVMQDNGELLAECKDQMAKTLLQAVFFLDKRGFPRNL